MDVRRDLVVKFIASFWNLYPLLATFYIPSSGLENKLKLSKTLSMYITRFL